ncbi:UDP-glycosyltransferase UGT5-like [Zophobas morio]|uniref:UDP-glycosyltransferase UGT5-like n=1 Tax=Zophobas morio TaxID=2755281 RepID=UPI00308270F6
MFLVFGVLLLSTSTLCSNILGVFTYPSFSHQSVFQSIWKELSLRGHNVTVVTPNPLNDPSLTNLTEISVRFIYDFLKQAKIQKVLSKNTNVFQSLYDACRFLDVMVEAEFNSTGFKKLIVDKYNHFDLVLVDGIHPLVYALAGRFKAPVVGVAPFGVLAVNYNNVGNPTHPVLYPDVLFGFYNIEQSIWYKIKSVLWSLWSRYHHHDILEPRAQGIAKEYFGDDTPYVGDIEKNQSMLFHNLNLLLYPLRPNVPMIVEMGQMHIKPVKPLPQDLQQILDNGTEGVIYFSLGSNVKSVNLDEKLRNVVIEALSELPYTVLWKWESDYLSGRPKNVVTRKWFPQQDILAHPNIRAFVTQGGLQSIEEAVSRGVPLIGMPFVTDQPSNIQKIEDIGIGLGVDPGTVTKEELKKCIIEVAENNKYHRRIHEIRDVMYDKPMTGLEKVVWWSEYVIRHKGAEHLRSPAADFTWFDYLLVEVVLVAVVLSGTVIYFWYKVIQLAIFWCK